MSTYFTEPDRERIAFLLGQLVALSERMDDDGLDGAARLLEVVRELHLRLFPDTRCLDRE